MKREREIWNFNVLLAEYYELDFYFEDEDSNFDDYPWFIQVDLKKLESACNAILGKRYNVETQDGKKEIGKDFQTGFGVGKKRVSQKQLCQLKAHLGNEQFFDKLDIDSTTVCDFYYKLFMAYKAGYKYIVSFEPFCCVYGKSTEYKIIDAFKWNEIDQIIAEANLTFFKCMKILLEKRIEQSFTRMELINGFDYPTTSNDEVMKAKREYFESLDNETW